MNQNFTNRQLQPGEAFNISGFKIDNSTGMGLENWNITLTKSDNTVMNNVTDSNGMYQFMNLSNGTYTVTEQMQPGWMNVSAMPMTVTINGSDMMNQNITNIVQLQPGETFSLSGFKIDNSTGMGLANWNITLTKPDSTVLNNVTDSSGMYQFMNLSNGIYNVTEQMQARMDECICDVYDSHHRRFGHDEPELHKCNDTSATKCNILRVNTQ